MSKKEQSRAGLALLIVSLALLLTSCNHGSPLPFRPISHIIIIVQENRSFDNLFHGYPGADTAIVGRTHGGKIVRLRPVSLRVPYDISNGVADFTQSFDGGRMDGFDQRLIVPARAAKRYGPYAEYGYVPRSEIAPYLELAKRYTLADHVFQSNLDQSFAAHLYLIAGQAARAVNVPTGRPWGCDAGPRARVQTLLNDRTIGPTVFPCFDFRTLGDELDARNLSWRYYAPQIDSNLTWRRYSQLMRLRRWPKALRAPDFGQLWSAYDAVAHDRYGPDWTLNVISPEKKILSDVRQGILANVTWVVPDFKNSDHSSSQSASGPSWVAAIVNAIGRSRFWSSSVIFVIWDDSGGWYDHVRPPQLDYDGLGFRVPLLVISPFAKAGYVSHAQYESASIVRFTEEQFGLTSLADSDRRASDLGDCFDFSRAPKRFAPIDAVLPTEALLRQRPSLQAPDWQ